MDTRYEINGEEILAINQVGTSVIKTHFGFVRQVVNKSVPGGTIYFNGLFNADTNEYVVEKFNNSPIEINGVLFDLDENGEVFIPDESSTEYPKNKQGFISLTKYVLWQVLERPIIFSGEKYSVTFEKQTLLSTELALYLMNTQSGLPYQLTWNTTGGKCVDYTFEELLDLSNAIALHVKPLVKEQQSVEVDLIASNDPEEWIQLFEAYKTKLYGMV